VELGTVGDTDRILFYRTDAQGAFIGFGILPAGKMMRKTRGLPLTATSHLDGVVINEFMVTTDEHGNIQSGVI
jgi:hypothetical protein